MTSDTTIHRRIRFRATCRRMSAVLDGAPERSSGRVPRVARLLALAIRLETLIESEAVRNYASLASVSHVSRSRITQITNLTLLAPDIQEAILFLPTVAKGRDPITERDLRPIVAEPDWAKQRMLWSRLMRLSDCARRAR